MLTACDDLSTLKEGRRQRNKKKNKNNNEREKWCNELYGECQEGYYWCPLRIEELEEEYEASRDGEEEKRWNNAMEIKLIIMNEFVPCLTFSCPYV